ncbi:MAG: hypothetical protein JO202_05285 [Ktedonobacteraceae bacterium]|nr:hypothetical protein [Ktedonobacteraceae bacterium]
MSVGNFDSINQALLAQRQRMEQLAEENRELRRQLSDLHEARGIFVEICGRRFALQADQVSMPTINATILTSAPLTAPAESMISIPQATTSEQQGIAVTEEISLVTVVDETATNSLSQPAPSPTDMLDDQEAKPATTTFLEEMLLDEFAVAATIPMTVQSDPVKKSEAIDEDEKAVLRRELVGSFLLE